ncbi:peptidase inhibitor family I36 protein [Actinomadura sp. HBU206391]|uniref:peptidase inhibitor family I36 protein n=1 Tax=Actinomadura sp. HBU206391 TaxID=2731692 RepID=UPI001DBFC33F|nr:peptidase inhibitor family I36 protein [Actinomadura sp. HBU206391]MBC6461582.1 peptidase inhibitor family I36 protein [Actinomadura sp. HBU206391]
MAASATVLGVGPAGLAAETSRDSARASTGDTPAAAAVPQYCPTNSICGWNGANFTGAMRTFPVGAGCVNSTLPLRSIANTFPGGGAGTMVTAHVYSSSNCGGQLVAVVKQGEKVALLSPPGASVNLTT